LEDDTMDAMLQTFPARSAWIQPMADEPAGPAGFAFRVLDEIDYGLVMLTAAGRLRHANQLASRELARGRFLRVEGGQVVGCHSLQTQELHQGLELAARGRRQMLMLRHGDDALPATCVPLGPPSLAANAPVLLILARQNSTTNLNVGFFSRSHGLTPAEEGVLRGLCEGLQLKEIARAREVALSTVRTHVRSLREKTGFRHIRLLVQRVTMLPPILPMDPTAPATATGDLHE
jgi:DNA-binding CsgD family transcriptional regulator